MCDCDKKIDEMLKGHNTRLSRAIVFGATSDVGLMLQTDQIETWRDTTLTMAQAERIVGARI